jgi:hypothetical protein
LEAQPAPKPAAKTIRRGISEPVNNYGFYCDAGGCVDTSWILTLANGSKAVMLNDDEYKHLQDLRKAVADEEKRLAVKYGAETRTIDENHFLVIPDHYELLRAVPAV